MNILKSENGSRPFAAKYKYKWQGWVAILFGVSLMGSSEIASFIFGLIFIGLGVYLLRGQGTSPKSIERSQKKVDKLASKIEEATRRLESSSGGNAVVAYRNLESIIKPTKSQENADVLEEILSEIKFDKSSIQSDHIGSLSGPSFLNSTKIEVYRNWIISGQTAYDVDVSTRGEVDVEGSIQIDAKGNKHDMRKAFIHFVSINWSQTFPFNLTDITEARRIVAQLAVVTDSLKPTGVTSADITKMMETIMNNSGQPAAEKLKQLSDLRFQRLLSDSEFEAAKTRILGI